MDARWSKLTRTVAPATPAVSTAEAKTHLRVEHTADDTYIAGLVAAAEATIEGPYGIGVAMVTQTWTLSFDGYLPTPVYLPLYPVQSVTGITYTDPDGQPATLDPELYQFARGNPAVIDRVGDYWPAMRRQLGAAVVTFVAGFGNAAAVPADLRHAVLLMVGHLYAHREAVGGIMHEAPLGFAALTERYRVGRFG